MASEPAFPISDAPVQSGRSHASRVACPAMPGHADTLCTQLPDGCLAGLVLLAQCLRTIIPSAEPYSTVYIAPRGLLRTANAAYLAV